MQYLRDAGKFFIDKNNRQGLVHKMALSYAEKAQRDVARLEAQLEKMAPRYEKALGRIEKARALKATRDAKLADAEVKFAKLEAKVTEAKRVIGIYSSIANADAASDELVVPDLDVEDVEDDADVDLDIDDAVEDDEKDEKDDSII